MRALNTALAALCITACTNKLPPVPEGALHPQVREQLTAARAKGTSEYCRMLHAYELYHAAVACYAQRPATPYLYGAALAALGRTDEAIAQLRQTTGEAAQIRLGETLLAAGRRAEARVEFGKAGPSAAARFGAARAGSPQAIELLQAICREDPQVGPPRLLLAQLLRASGRIDEANSVLAQVPWSKSTVVFPDPEYDELRQLRRDPGFFAEEGRRRQESGDLAGAEREYQRALERDAKFGPAHANLLAVAGARGDYAAAELHYRQASPVTEEVHANWGKVLVAQRRYAEAAEAFRAAIAKAEGFADAHHDLGFTLQQLGRTPEAIAAYQRALAVDSQHQLAHLNLGRLYLATGRKAEAAAQFELVTMRPDPEAARLIYAAADGLQKAGRRQRAQEFARAALGYARRSGDQEFAAQVERGLEILSRP